MLGCLKDEVPGECPNYPHREDVRTASGNFNKKLNCRECTPEFCKKRPVLCKICYKHIYGPPG